MAIDDRQINDPNANVPFFRASRLGPLVSEFLSPRRQIEKIRNLGVPDQTVSEQLIGTELPPALSDMLQGRKDKEEILSRLRESPQVGEGIRKGDLRDKDLFKTDPRLADINRLRGTGAQIGPRDIGALERGVKGKEGELSPKTKTALQQGSETIKTAQDATKKVEELGKKTKGDGSQKSANTEKDAKSLAEQYASEISSLFPEFEGKTKQEKGMDLAKLGMAIAAGDSPNAIQNISKGFLAMGDTFTEDAKEKRQYERQVKLATTEAVISRLKEDRDREFELEKLDIEAYNDAYLARLEQIADLKELGTTSLSDIQEQLTLYTKNYESIADLQKAKRGLKEVAKIYFSKEGEYGDVTGIGGALKKTLDDGLNAVGLQYGENAVRDAIANPGTEKSQKILRALELKLVPLLLGEAGKTISDRDRELIRTLMGGFDKTSQIFVSKEVLKTALAGVEERLNDEIAKANRGMDVFEKNYGSYLVAGKPEGTTGLDLEEIKKRRELGTVGPIKISDIGTFDKDGKFIFAQTEEQS